MSLICDLKTYTECPITQQPMQDPYLVQPCGHSFEKEAICNWYKQNPICPLDRFKIESLRPNVSLQQVFSQVKQLSEEDSEIIKKTEELKNEIIRIIESDISASKEIAEKKQKQLEEMEQTFTSHLNEGLYLLTCCTNRVCSLYMKQDWLYQGIGNFNLNTVCYTTACQSCNKEFQNINAATIRGITYSWEGRKITGQPDSHTQRETMGQPTYKIFPNLSEWRYLEILV